MSSAEVWGRFDPLASNEHRAVAHLLTHSALGRKFDPERHVDDDGFVDFPALVGDCYSSSERLLAFAAWELWNGGGNGGTELRLREVVIGLDDAQFQALVEAMQLHRRRR